MPYSYRGEPALESQPVPEPRQDAGAEQGKAEPAQQPAEPDRLVPAMNAIESAIRELKAADDAIERERQVKREIADLKAQQRMAFWAIGMFWATLAAVWITAAGVYLIWQTLGHTRRAADAAVATLAEAKKHTVAAFKTVDAALKSNEIQSNSLVLAHRAWITHKVSIVEPLTWQPDHKTAFIGFAFSLRNVGATPAFGARIELKIDCGTRGSPISVYNGVAAEARQIPFGIGFTLGRDYETVERITIHIPTYELDAWFDKIGIDGWHNECAMFPKLIGCIDYGLVFKDTRGQTGFIYEIVRTPPAMPGAIGPTFGDLRIDQLQLLQSDMGNNFYS